jgi:sugar O-acyltransferase (sialic acid O-acetyltransferase NeuD family)
LHETANIEDKQVNTIYTMNIVIIGARKDGHANVVLEIILAMKQFEVAGFIDDDPAKLGQLIRGYPILGGMKDIPQLMKEKKVQGAIVAIGDNPGRRLLAAQAENMGLELINAIHPTVHIDSEVSLGKGICLCQGVIVVTGTRIGNCVNIHTGATIDHDNVIEEGANLGPGVHTAGRVKIRRDAFLGVGAVVIPDGEVGEGAIIGAGSVVVKPIPPFVTAVGVPAKVIKTHS